jgi:hypothetical protein
MVSRLDFDVLKEMLHLAPKQEKRISTPEQRSVTLHMGHQRRWKLKSSTDSSSHQTSFCWTKTRAS